MGEVSPLLTGRRARIFPKGPREVAAGPANGYRRVATNVYVFIGTDTERNPKNGSTFIIASIRIRYTNTVIIR